MAKTETEKFYDKVRALPDEQLRKLFESRAADSWTDDQLAILLQEFRARGLVASL
ncbi:MAG: hypothetical protein KW802_04485 [Candidatus Doudnabacteria bacterium]|nr:hypothetical protein [Candidatus Doudnabacteria bacterium]